MRRAKSENFNQGNVRRIKWTSPGVVIISLLALTSAAFSAETYEYDTLGRLTKVTYDSGETVTYTYDAAGNRTQKVTATANTPPVATDDPASTSEDVAHTFDPTTNDMDADAHALTITGVTQGANGAVSFSGNDVTYTPNANWNGVDTYTYTISDGNGGSDTATVTMTVTAVADAPDAVDDPESTDQDVAKTFDPRTNDTDPEGDALTVTAVTQGTNGSVSFTTASVTYTPNTGWSGTDTFTYTISDGNGGSDTATVTMTVNAAPSNSPPTAVDDNFNYANGSGWVNYNITSNDTDPDGDSLTITSLISISGNGNAVIVDASTIKYKKFGAFGSGTKVLEYTISDGNGGTDVGRVYIDYSP